MELDVAHAYPGSRYPIGRGKANVKEKLEEKRLTRATVNEDDPEEWARYLEQLLDRAEGRIKEAVKELQDRSIMDGKGRRVKKDLPLDMQPDSETDV